MNRTLAKAGVAAAAFAVFTCGWLGMKTDDWRKMTLYAVLALASGAVASAFSRHAR
jgi:hypothetical protein